MPLTPDEWEPVLSRLERQAEDLGAKNQEIERLHTLIRGLNDQLQAKTSEAEISDEALRGTCEIANQAKADQLHMGREIDELATALRRAEDANVTLRLALNAMNVDKRATR